MKTPIATLALLAAFCTPAITFAESQSTLLNACELLTQQEIDALFERSVGPGQPSNTHGEVNGCGWPATGQSHLIVFVVPAPVKVHHGVDLGDGYRIVELEGLSGEAAAAVRKGNPPEEGAGKTGVIGVISGEMMLTLTPVKLEIMHGTEKFEQLKQLADKAAQRM